MNTLSLKLKRKVVGFQNNGSEKDILTSEPISILDDCDVTLSTNGQEYKPPTLKIVEYKNTIRALESSLQRAREESFQAGFDEGKEIGIKEIKVQLEDLSRELVSTTDSLDDQYRHTLRKLRKPLVSLSIKIAEKIIGQELKHAEVYDEVVKRQIGRLLSEVADQNKITIYLNPRQIPQISKVEEQEIERLTGKVKFVGKDDLMPGECLVETEDYVLEGLIERQLRNIEDTMLGKEKLG